MASYDDTATVSGSVVGFSNGADSVPLKNWLVTLPASLDGYSEVNGVKAKKNLFNAYGTDTDEGYIQYYYLLNTGETYYNSAWSTSEYIEVKENLQYTLSGIIGGNPSICFYDENKTFLSGVKYGGASPKTVTTPTGAKFARVSFENSLKDVWQLEVGSTATAYEAYEAPTQYTAELGRTIYGGTADIVTGEGSETYDNTSLDDLNYNYLSNITRFNVAISGADSSGYKDNIVIPTGYTISHTLITNASNAPDMTMCMYNGSLYVKNLSCTSKAELQSALSGKTLTFPLATPETFTFTPITPTPETAKGSNTFWSDQGNTELTYYKDGYGFTSVTIHKETPDGEPVEETRKLHRIIYEGQVDVISGTGLIYRGESGTQYDPPEQISFTPIEVSTDEGENTLYADEGDSAIVYRKAVE